MLATAGVVLLIFLVVPRDDANRIPHIDYKAVATQATATSPEPIIVPDLPSGWWSNNAQWHAKPVDAVPRFEAGFVGTQNQYLGYIQAFSVNPTWLALEVKDVTLLKEVQIGSVKWSIYKSSEVHEPVKTRDYIWIATVKSNAFELFGTATEAQFKTFATNVTGKIGS